MLKKQNNNILKGSSILITGGTGSFGNSFLQYVLTMDPRHILIFSRDEEKQFHMRNAYDDGRIKFIIGDVRDYTHVLQTLTTYKVDYIFHAAALKQVPTCEFFPLEAIKTNSMGAEHVIQAAINTGVKKVVILSTDKAVYPINAMGMSKALMEKIMMAHARNVDDRKLTTTLCGVRYGNVMYSRGSVIPYFISQIQSGKKLTVTNRHMTRFLLSLPSAVDLVNHALLHGKNGSLYVRKAPACTMETLAQALCELFNYTKGYREVVVRAGEKIHETLMTEHERSRSQETASYFEIPLESQHMDYDQYFYHGTKRLKLPDAYTSANTKQLTIQETMRLLRTLPEIKQALANYHE
jgi:UDP-glucose 4-epimerase